MSAATSHIANELTLPVEKVRAEKEKYGQWLPWRLRTSTIIVMPRKPTVHTTRRNVQSKKRVIDVRWVRPQGAHAIAGLLFRSMLSNRFYCFKIRSRRQ